VATEETLPQPPTRRLRVRRLAIVASVLVVLGAAASLFGWEIGVWLEHLWNTITSLSLATILGAVALVTLQTVATSFAWFTILRYGYPDAEIGFTQVLACYATAVGLNCVLPANLGTLVMLLMYSSIIAGATFAGVIAAYVVQKAFYTAIGIFTYLYLFLTVGGSFDLQFGFLSEHVGAAILLLIGGGTLLFLVYQVLRERIAKWWEEAKEGGQILVHPKAYLTRVLAPEIVSWFAMLGIIAVFLAAYDIPVSFHILMRVVGGNSIANMTSVTPGGAGVQQAFNTISLKGITSTANATAYSVAQQLVTTAWSVLFAIVMVIHAFGWSGGSMLVKRSYSEAKEKRSEQAAARKAKREARKGQRTDRRHTPR
jgi:uncharacterized membrane protein YbhN (UPF0104 family)